jgi:hypothetical protein
MQLCIQYNILIQEGRKDNAIQKVNGLNMQSPKEKQLFKKLELEFVGCA